MAVKRDKRTSDVVLPDTGALTAARWFAGKGRTILAVTLSDVLEPQGAAGAVLAIVEVRYLEGERERYALPLRDGAECAGDDAIWTALGRLAGVESASDGARFVAEDLSNTVVSLGDRHLLKLFRRVEQGPHPEAELLATLGGFPHAPELAGVVEHDGSTLLVVQEYVKGEPLGWEGLISRLAAGDEALDDVREFARVTAETHRRLAAALGVRIGDQRDVDLAQDRVEVALATSGLVGEPASVEPEVRERARALARLAGEPLQRVHGDLHVGQVLRADDGRLVLVDFEGEPALSLEARAREHSALVDLASLLLSFDHAGCAAARREPAFDWRRWSERARAEARAAYEATVSGAVDLELLRALEVAKELRELAYATRWLPEWLYAPRTVLPTLVEDGA
jgi:maltokinase